MIIDCDTCVARDIACGDCVVRVLLATPSPALEAPEVAALAVLADGGLVPPLRLLPAQHGAADSRPSTRSAEPPWAEAGSAGAPGESVQRPGLPPTGEGRDRAAG